MSSYIDADALLKYKAQLYDENGVGFYAVGTGNILRMPTADVVEVVRCKDCKHYKIDHPRANGYHCCYRMHSIFPMKPDDYCSYGERREDEIQGKK